MNLLQKLLRKFDGLHYSQEYLCLAREQFQQPPHVYIVSDGRVIRDITNNHLFIGYKPLIFSLSFLDDLPAKIDLIFSQKLIQPSENYEKKDALAHLSLKLIKKQVQGDTTVGYYEGINGRHQFLSAFHQSVIGLNNRLFNNRPGNIYLEGNLYKQVQIAYSVPRIISLATVSNGHLFNLFPTDLHGRLDENFYVSSLRHDGKACRQVEQPGKVVISEIHAKEFRTAYSLGKNHMRDTRSIENFPFSNLYSKVFKLPLPAEVLSYYELEVMGSFVRGLHKIFLYRIVSQQTINNESATLAHIHNSYATWRYNHKFQDDFLLR